MGCGGGVRAYTCPQQVPVGLQRYVPGPWGGRGGGINGSASSFKILTLVDFF